MQLAAERRRLQHLDDLVTVQPRVLGAAAALLRAKTQARRQVRGEGEPAQAVSRGTRVLPVVDAAVNVDWGAPLERLGMEESD